jgi:hypothetical protein
MRSIFRVLIAIPLLAYLFSSCDKIKEPYATSKHGNIVDTVMEWDSVPVKRVLLEDYTGHKCVNCPEATVIAHSLEESYEGKLLVLAVHAGYQALPGSGDYAADYRSEAGEAWNIDFGINSINPQGMVDRKEFDGSRVLPKAKWSDDVAIAMTEAPIVQMMATNTYDTNTHQVQATIYAHFPASQAGSYHITVLVSEDSLISAQKNNNPNVGTTPDIFNYVFMDVLREAINGTYGEVLTTKVDPALTYMGKFSFQLDPSWIAKNCWIYAYVSKSDTREIMNVMRHRIIRP